MGLADALENARDGNIWKQLCAVHKAMNEHPEEADTIFEFCTWRHDKPATSIARTLRAHDINVHYQAIQRHRNRRCACDQRMPERYDVE